MRDDMMTPMLSKDLEDAFFIKEDKKLIDNLKRIKEMQKTKESLRQISRIENDQVLQKLVELKIEPQTMAPLSLIPLIEVGWADGSVDAKEKAAILKALETRGIAPNSLEYQLIEQWMTHKPDKKLFEAWIHYIQGLCEKLNEKEKAVLKKELVSHATAVAKASGGLMGVVGKVSSQEKDVLKRIEKAFES